MSSTSFSREALVAAVAGALGRDLSTWTVLFHTAVAEHFGLNTTDHKALDLIDRQGPLTAGELAEATGLTTGAITGVIDRLERAGYVQRAKDPHDRRKVVIQALPSAERNEAFEGIFAPLAQATAARCERYSDEELAAIYDFMQGSVELLQQEIARLRATPKVRRSEQHDRKDQ